MYRLYYLSFGLLIAVFLGLTPLASAEDIDDPLEPVNRGIFWFNEQFDNYLLEPVAKGYRSALPKFVRNCVGNFFENIQYPIYLLSDLTQLKFKQAGHHTVRFITNSTFGVAGLLDPAEEWGWEEHKEDFGAALGYYGVPPGPYLVIPILGPSNLRDAFGLIVNTAVHPMTIAGYSTSEPAIRYGMAYGSRALEIIDARSSNIEAIEDARDSAVDFYLFMQAAYYQRRDAIIYDGNPPEDFEDFDELEQIEEHEGDDIETIEETTP